VLRARRDIGNASKIVRSKVFDAFPMLRRALYRVIKLSTMPLGVLREKQGNYVAQLTLFYQVRLSARSTCDTHLAHTKCWSIFDQRSFVNSYTCRHPCKTHAFRKGPSSPTAFLTANRCSLTSPRKDDGVYPSSHDGEMKRLKSKLQYSIPRLQSG
jgi:hypothetical protein